MNQKFLGVMLISILIISCNTVKKAVATTISQGNVVTQNYKEEITFDYYQKFIFVSLTINEKDYQFIYDTGNVLTAIDDDVAGEIVADYKDFSARLKDANDGSRNTELITVKKINIGNIEFENIGAQITDLSAISESLGCKEIHGVIGSNLIRKAKWQIDYKNKTIVFSDHLESLIPNTNDYSINTVGLDFNQMKLEVKLNNESLNYLLDTGYNGFIKSNLETFKKIKNQENFDYLESYNIGFSAFSKNIDTTYYSSIKNISLNTINFQNQIVNFRRTKIPLIGNRFLEHYLFTIDWNTKKIYLAPVKKMKEDFFRKFEIAFGPNYKTNTINITRVLSNNNELTLGTKLLKINNIDVSKFNKDELCEFWKKHEYALFNNFDKLSIEISNNGTPKEIELVKKEFLKS
ncbi:hypothetical protein GTQ40_05330 [Flavobacteriaceae bacterium R38]|nr:hypothetical protein [Flavobacteriaceae bacterium R38]